MFRRQQMKLCQGYTAEKINNDGIKELCYELIRITVKDIRMTYKCDDNYKIPHLKYLERVLKDGWFCEALDIDGQWIYDNTIRRCERDKARAIERDKKAGEETKQISKSDVSVRQE